MVRPLWISHRFWDALKMTTSILRQGIGNRNLKRNLSGRSNVTTHVRQSSKRGKREKRLCVLVILRHHHHLQLGLPQSASTFQSRIQIQKTFEIHLKHWCTQVFTFLASRRIEHPMIWNLVPSLTSSLSLKQTIIRKSRQSKKRARGISIAVECQLSCRPGNQGHHYGGYQQYLPDRWCQMCLGI